jgi:hypothetical protein
LLVNGSEAPNAIASKLVPKEARVHMGRVKYLNLVPGFVVTLSHQVRGFFCHRHIRKVDVYEDEPSPSSRASNSQGRHLFKGTEALVHFADVVVRLNIHRPAPEVLVLVQRHSRIRSCNDTLA